MTGAIRTVTRFALALFYGMAGLVHLVSPEAFLPIMPEIVPWPRAVIIVTGLCEIAGAFGLFHPASRRAAGLGLALYAVCVWPANFRHAFEGIAVAGLPTGWWYHGPRLLLQPVIIAITLWVSGWLGKPKTAF